jgi:hypothetical protein
MELEEIRGGHIIDIYNTWNTPIDDLIKTLEKAKSLGYITISAVNVEKGYYDDVVAIEIEFLKKT